MVQAAPRGGVKSELWEQVSPAYQGNVAHNVRKEYRVYVHGHYQDITSTSPKPHQIITKILPQHRQNIVEIWKVNADGNSILNKLRFEHQEHVL